MGRGRKPPPNDPPVRPRDNEIEQDEFPEQCWTFPLVDTTSAAARAANGTPVTGSVQRRKRVMVSAKGEALGFAPDPEAAEMIATAAESGGSLRGSIVGADKTGANVLVELCLRG